MVKLFQNLHLCSVSIFHFRSLSVVSSVLTKVDPNGSARLGVRNRNEWKGFHDTFQAISVTCT